MTRFNTLAVVACLLAFLVESALGQEPGEDHDALRALKMAYESAVNERKIENLTEHLHEDFSGVMVTGEAIESLAELKLYWSKIQNLIGSGGTYRVELRPDISRIEGQVALAKGVTHDHVVTSAGQEYSFESQWTAVLRKVDQRWKILRIQATMDPIENEFVQVAVKGGVITGVVGGGAIGVVVGVLLKILLGRRRAS